MVEVAPGWTLNRKEVSVSEQRVSVSVLRLARDDAQSTARLGAVFDLRWPDTPNTMAEGLVRVAWIAPGQWALFGAGAAIEVAVAQACGPALRHLAEVSAGRRLWRIEGEAAGLLTSKGCSLDLHPLVMPAGRCARTLFADIPVLLIGDGSGRSFDIIADASFAGHLEAWFVAATLEFAQ